MGKLWNLFLPLSHKLKAGVFLNSYDDFYELLMSQDFNDDDIAVDEFLEFTCTRCGFSEPVPTWVIGEQRDMDIFAGADPENYIPKTTCMHCEGITIPSDKL